MRPVISDSLISGQPLYLLYSKPCGSAPGWPALAALAMQATGKVRLQVTGRPPTWIGDGAALARAGANNDSVDRADRVDNRGAPAATRPPSSWRRSGESGAWSGAW